MKKKRSERFILWFDELGIEDVPLVGGKNASLGEMYRLLTPKGVRIPNGFAVTAYAYHYLLEKAGVKEHIRAALKGLNTKDVNGLAERGHKVRDIILNAHFPQELKDEIISAYRLLCRKEGTKDVAVRSSATAEDLPDASFAGQQETYLNIVGEAALIDACKRCFASLFTNRAISYRVDKGFDHFKIGLSIGVQKMVRSDMASAGVMFSIDTETGFKDAVFITGAYGLGENVVQGNVNPDEFYVFKPTLKQGFRSIILRRVGEKSVKMIYDLQGNKPTKNVNVPLEDRKKFVLEDDEVVLLAKWACIIEDHYSAKAGHFKPMDMEWAKDGKNGKLYIVQARPETVQSQKDWSILEEYELAKKSEVLITGRSVGEKIDKGKVNVIKDAKDISRFSKGQVLVTDMTDPDWEPIMKIASAIVTNRGGRTCFTGDTILLTNKGFMSFEEVFNSYDQENLMTLSLNKETLKTEWKPITAAMRRRSHVIKVNLSQTGRMKDNCLKLTPDHRMLTYIHRTLEQVEIKDILNNQQMITMIQKIPSLNESSNKDNKLAYLLGAISTDGHVHLSDRHGEVQFIQKPIFEKQEFIDAVNNYMFDVFSKKVSICPKKAGTGLIRGKPVVGSANAYRFYGKQIAIQMLEHQQKLVQTLLAADNELILNFLAGVIDGDGTYNNKQGRINIYCSKEPLLQAITVGCLRLGIVPQVSVNRTIYNVQIVEKIDLLLSYTKRVKGESNRTIMGTRFFSAKQLLGDIQDKVNFKGGIKTYVSNNLLIDSSKIAENILPMCSEKEKIELKRVLDSDTRMMRADFVEDSGDEFVYNMTVEENHNYVVFTNKYTPVLVNNCHAAIISRELGIPCVVGCGNATEKLKSGWKVTVSCAEGEIGCVYKGLLPIRIRKVNIKKLPKPKTRIMMNLADPEQAFGYSFIPNDGIGLAREEFIITSHIQIHPLALLNYHHLTDMAVKAKIDELTHGYKDKVKFYVDKLAEGIAMIGAAFYPKDVIVRFSDFKTNEYANLIGGKLFEPHEENPMIGFRGASRYYSNMFRPAFALECKAIHIVREKMGLTNVKVMIPFCRTIAEGEKVLDVMRKNGLKRGKNGLQVYVMCEIPSNVILAEGFCKLFDGFSIGSNDLTQLTLGLDRDSELVSHIYDERNDAVKSLIRSVISVAKKHKRKIGICGQAPSDYPEFAQFLVECGIDSISLNPDTVIKTTLAILKEEKRMNRH